MRPACALRSVLAGSLLLCKAACLLCKASRKSLRCLQPFSERGLRGACNNEAGALWRGMILLPWLPVPCGFHPHACKVAHTLTPPPLGRLLLNRDVQMTTLDSQTTSRL